MKNSDQPAFPLAYDEDKDSLDIKSGLTKRELFSINILSAMVSGNTSPYSEHEEASKLAIRLADMLLNQLEK